MEQKHLERLFVDFDLIDVLNVLDQEPVDGEDWNLLSRPSIDILASQAEFDPALGGEVDCLTNVESCRKACVIRSRQCQNEFSRLLKRFVYFYL